MSEAIGTARRGTPARLGIGHDGREDQHQGLSIQDRDDEVNGKNMGTNNV